jgi:hypothetical protein
MINTLLAFGVQPPGVGPKLSMIGGWISYVAAWAAGLAFVVCGAALCWAYFSGHGSSRVMKALGGACIGTVLITAAAALTNQLLS